MSQASPHAMTIFGDALECASPDERARYLDRACGGDPDLRTHIEHLLRAHGEAGQFLGGDRPGAAAAGGGPASMADAAAGEGPGARVGPYKLLEQIGEGGFGVVYMAEQEHPVRRRVAVKVIKPGMDTRQVIARFEAERQALALMDHPNIARVLDAGEAGGRPYFVMELIRGIPITQYCDQNNVPPRERLRLFVLVCQAIQHAHQKGIIHRDLKPNNVLVTLHDGTPVVKVIDFGIAKAMGQQLTEKTLFTNFAAMVGTPLYMSPEQAEMSGLNVDTRTDVYSLGVLLYELLTGTTPFDAERLKQAGFDEVRRIIREEDPPAPSTRLSTLAAPGRGTVSARRRTDPAQLGRLVRGELDWIVMRALSKDRRHRYDTAGAFAADVEHYLCDEPVNACPPSTMYRFRKFASRYRGPLLAGAVIVLALLLGTAVSLWQAIRATAAGKLAEQRLGAETIQREQAVAAREDAKRRLVDARLAQARSSRYARQPGQRFESWRAVSEASQLAQELGLGKEHLLALRNEAIACLALPDVRVVSRRQRRGPVLVGVMLDPELEVYALDRKGRISIRRMTDNEQLRELDASSRAQRDGDQEVEVALRVGTTLFSPDGKFLAIRFDPAFGSTGRSSYFQLWDWKEGRLVLQPLFPVSGNAIAFSPDGGRLALGRADGTITLYDTSNGEPQRQFKLDLMPMALAVSPDNARLAVASFWGKHVYLCDVSNGAGDGFGTVVRKLPHPCGIWSVAWSSDGSLLAAGGTDRNIHVWDPNTGSPHAILRGHQNGELGVTFAGPGGDVLVSWSWDWTTRLWDPWSGQELVRFPGLVLRVGRDGRRFATEDGRDIAVWEIAPSGESRTLPRRNLMDGEEPGRGGFSPDGRWLALAARDGVRAWDVALGTQVQLPKGEHTRDIQFHPGKTDLLTSGDTGVYRWPISADPSAGTLRVGPPRKLPASGPLGQMSMDKDGRRLTVIDARRRGAWAFDMTDPAAQSGMRLLPHVDANSVATHPDGRWAATGTQHGRGVKVWNLADGRLVKELVHEDWGTKALFSPDGRWLVTGTPGAFCVWRVDDWEPVRQIPRREALYNTGMAFSPDGRILAMSLSQSAVELFDVEAGEVFAKLEAADLSPVLWVFFSPDGSQLGVTTMSGDVRLWDLRAIRARLREVGLDWRLPAYGPAAWSSADDVKPVAVEVKFPQKRRPGAGSSSSDRGSGVTK